MWVLTQESDEEETEGESDSDTDEITTSDAEPSEEALPENDSEEGPNSPWAPWANIEDTNNIHK